MHNTFSYTVRAAALMEKTEVSHIMGRSLLLTSEHAWAPSLVVHRAWDKLTMLRLGWLPATFSHDVQRS